MIFWGDEIGELWPPMLAASAIASCGRNYEEDIYINNTGR
jgi:hypothetical protein